MNHFPEAWGRPRNDVYGAYDHSHFSNAMPNQHTQSPVVTGTSVVAVKFKDGVVIAADNLASYGSLARFTDVKRLHKFNSRAVLGFGGDVSDMQYLDRLLTSLSTRENYHHPTSDADTADQMSAKNLYTYLSKVMYKRRSDFNPLWNAILVAGLDGENQPFLASVDLLGTTFTSPTLATGFGAHLAQPILRRTVPDEAAAKKLGREEAVALIRECMKVLFYRDARSMDQYSIAIVERDGEVEGAAEGKKVGGKVELHEKEKLENQSWAFAEGIRGYGTQVN